jgi:hypothetical protein
MMESLASCDQQFLDTNFQMANSKCLKPNTFKFYHAVIESTAERKLILEQFRSGSIKGLAATSVFDLGIDNEDIDCECLQ